MSGPKVEQNFLSFFLPGLLVRHHECNTVRSFYVGHKITRWALFSNRRVFYIHLQSLPIANSRFQFVASVDRSNARRRAG